MTYNETEILIKKYLNGETTAEEERTLACEVAREDVPDDWKVIAGMLGELTVDEALFDQMMAERKTKPRIVRLWPWVAAACVAATVEVKGTEPKAIEPKEQNISQVTARPRQPHKANRRANVSKRIAKEEIPTPRPVEESDIVPFEDSRMQFAEQARSLRERGNRVIQRVSMNGLPSNNYQLNDL